MAHLFDNEKEFADILLRPVIACDASVRMLPAQKPEQGVSVATNLDQPDLFYFESVFVTAGRTLDKERGVPVGWNKNDEFFDNVDAWMARKTPEDKQLNLNHNCAYLVGHITDVLAEDLTGAALEDTDIAPDDFNLITKAVLYRVWWNGKERDTEKEQLVATVIEEMAEDKWKVSMECLFHQFDYALLNSDGSVEIVKRTKANSHMTKALRIVGGDGKYDGRRIARVPRNYTFSGKGIVANPANPKSIIRADAILPDFSNEKPGKVYEKTTVTNTEQKKMELEQLKAELTAAKAALADLQAKQNEAEQKRIVELTTAVEVEKSAKAALETSMKAATEQAKAAAEKLASEKAELETSLAAAKAEIAEAKTKQLKAERSAKVVSALKLEQAKADEIVNTLAGLSEEQFTAHIDLLTASLPKPTDTPKLTNLPEPEKKTSLPEPKSAFAAHEGGKDGDHTKELDQAVITPEPDLAAAAEATKQAEKVSEIIAKRFGWTPPAQA